MLNFMPVLWLILTRRETLNVLKMVTIGMGAFIHISKAYARLVSWGLTAFICVLFSCTSIPTINQYANIAINVLNGEIIHNSRLLILIFFVPLCPILNIGDRQAVSGCLIGV